MKMRMLKRPEAILLGLLWICSCGKKAPQPAPAIQAEAVPQATPAEAEVVANPPHEVVSPGQAVSSSDAPETCGKNQVSLMPVRRSDSAVPVAEFAAVHDFLSRTQPPPGQSWERFYALKNKLMNRYASSDPLPPGFLQLMLSLAGDRQTELVTRAYAIQYLGLGLYAGASRDRRIQIERTLEQCAAEYDSCIGGTALLAAYRLWRRHDAFGKERLKELVQAPLANERADRATRATALRLAGMLGCADGVVRVAETARWRSGIEASALQAAWRDLRLAGQPACKRCF